jgi:hypothetical protein
MELQPVQIAPAKDVPIGAHIEHMGEWLKVTNKLDCTESYRIQCRQLGFSEPQDSTIVFCVPKYGTNTRVVGSESRIEFRH